MDSSGISVSEPIRVEVDLEALEGNLRHIERLAGAGQHIIAAVKGNAYGHGVVEIALALERLGIHSLATGSPAEARAIREAGVGLPILMFGSSPPEETAALALEGFVPTLMNFETAQAISGSATRPTPVYIKVDAGLGRLGVSLEEAHSFVERTTALPNVLIEGIYTHVPFSAEPGRAWAASRIAAFDSLITELEGSGHAAPITQVRASSCLLAGFTDRCNAVCVGHLLYGLSPYAPDVVADLSALRPVLRSVKTRLIHVGHHGQGADVAIGGLYGIERARTVGVAPVGLAHGFARVAPGKTPFALVGGKRVRILAVSLEHTTVDLDGSDTAAPGDEVTLLGGDGPERITLDDLAGWHDESPIETVMRLSGRAEISTVDPAAAAWSEFDRR